ncbi:polysaccharide biosynthesis protein [Microbacterium sp. zg.Y1090]|uniref:lipopolysaccharide biosynthesis protein n=1 Tax=Microbacterium TaxID=33882 RepID=UPI00214C644B|nr:MULTISPECIES: polysaccharide biosynthesis protein [unclassified Microbacterium]MCR2814118.1 polysaccharide biosynthesis protein [Microbacterium sp. zg.Y1084]MCR2817877.1 polysaccharide biosynthesis protein [Microbacterium sp. zg.Y1090]MDL5487731.1 polysaccharide biosynthesis protein [Microbacterium sp. zg-Y1211]WIM27953.1 polysaccharide biosynthesis protein [Microbacterium sp. zg-Y1090]
MTQQTTLHPDGAAGADTAAPARRRRRGLASIEDLGSRRGTLLSIGSSAAARFIVLPISAVLGIVVTRLIIDNYGVASYGQYILLVAIAGLIPFSDLGLTAAIMNAVAGAKDPRTDSNLRLVLISCMRLLFICSSVVIVVAVVLFVSGLWPTVLGGALTPESGALAATLCLAIFGLNMLIAYGQRILAALGLNVLVVLLGAIQTPIVLAVLWVMIATSADGGYIAVASYAATTVICLIAMIIASRKLKPMLGSALRGALDRRIRGARVMNTAWPMLIQMVALPIAMSSDRLVLSLIGTLDDLAQYSLANQIFSPVFAVVTAAGFALWPVFAKARAAGKAAPVSPMKMSVAFAVAAAAACLALSLAAGWLAELASGGQIQLPASLLIAFSVFIVIQSAKYPFGMYLTDASGLRFQAYLILGMLPVNLGLTILLIPALGSLGPVVGSIVGVLAFQLIPNAVLVRRRVREVASSSASTEET